MSRNASVALVVIKIATALLPPRERRIMAEAWAADLLHADELGIEEFAIARGAMLFFLRHGPTMWWRRHSLRVAVGVLATVTMATAVSPWFLLLAISLGLVAWLISSPTTQLDSDC